MVIGGFSWDPSEYDDDDGISDDRHVDIIDLNSSTTVCSPVAEFPFVTYGAAGGLMNSKTPFVCGSQVKNKDTCYVYSRDNWNELSHLTVDRYGLNIVEIKPFQGNSTKLLAIGSGNTLYSEIYDGKNWTKANFIRRAMFHQRLLKDVEDCFKMPMVGNSPQIDDGSNSPSESMSLMSLKSPSKDDSLIHSNDCISIQQAEDSFGQSSSSSGESSPNCSPIREYSQHSEMLPFYPVLLEEQQNLAMLDSGKVGKVMPCESTSGPEFQPRKKFACDYSYYNVQNCFSRFEPKHDNARKNLEQYPTQISSPELSFRARKRAIQN